MKKRRLGNTDLDLSVVGLGTWAIGGSWAYGWGNQEDQDSIDTILESLELGINWIDTAPAYGVGHGEVVVGRALKKWRERGGDAPIVATKCGLVPQPDKTVLPCLTRESILKECDESLRRLGVERIDIYQIHWPKPPGDIGEAFQTLLELQTLGKIRWAGVSNFSVAQLEHISQYGPIASLQPPYSMINRGIEDGVLDWCIAHGVGVIPYSPLQCGMLTGKVTPAWIDSLPADDWRKTKSEFFKEPKLSRSLAFVRELGALPVAKEHPLMEIAIQWILGRRGITSAICGARKPGQIKDTISAVEWQLTPSDEAAIDRLYKGIFES